MQSSTFAWWKKLTVINQIKIMAEEYKNASTSLVKQKEGRNCVMCIFADIYV
jgi:hypothetical protein